MLRTAVYTLNTTPVKLSISDEVEGPSTLHVKNLDNSKHVYLGGSNVTSTSFGMKLEPLENFVIDLGPYDHLWAAGETGSSVSVLILER